MADLDKPFTVTAPGLYEVIKVPPLQDKQYRREQAIRMAQANSALPERLQWVPKVINKLDDTQDILYTALVLGKYILPKLGLRLIPGLGWALLANDVLNLATAVLATSIAGRGPKKTGYQLLQAWMGRSGRKLAATQQFMARTNWWAFGIQAAQASETITGYGLSLGGLMGMVTDTTWAVIRAPQNPNVVFRGPPPSDPLAKAARYLTRNPDPFEGWQLLNKEQQAQQLTAHAIAYQTLNTHHQQRADEIQWSGNPPTHEHRMERYRTFLSSRARFIAEEPFTHGDLWNDASIAALNEALPTVPHTMRNAYPGYVPTALIQDHQTQMVRDTHERERHMRAAFRDDALGGYLAQIISEASIANSNLILGPHALTNYKPRPAEHVCMRMIEHDIRPSTWPPAATCAAEVDTNGWIGLRDELKIDDYWDSFVAECMRGAELQNATVPTVDVIAAAWRWVMPADRGTLQKSNGTSIECQIPQGKIPITQSPGAPNP